MRPTAAVLLGSLMLCGNMTNASGYRTGGVEPLPAEQQARLDAHAEILTLGINTEWMALAGIDSDLFTQGIAVVAEAAKRGEIPGAVVYVDSFVQHTMPVGIGWRIVSPERHPVLYDTHYEVHDLTTPLLVAPLILSQVAAGTIALEGTVADYLKDFEAAPMAALTIEVLLRGTSGLATDFPVGASPTDRSSLTAALKSWPLEADQPNKAQRSPAEALLLGLILESVTARPLGELAKAEVADRLQLQTYQFGTAPEKRQWLAPGGMSEFLGHMAWGDPRDPWARAYGTPAPHWGLTVTADDASTLARVFLALAMANTTTPSASAPPFTKLVLGGEAIPGRTLGFDYGRYGSRSFGMDSRWGSSIWILPEAQGFIIFLSNDDHPTGTPGRGASVRSLAMDLFAGSLLKGKTATGVDFTDQGTDSLAPSAAKSSSEPQ